jgi:DNA polymerase-3 subunit beta
MAQQDVRYYLNGLLIEAESSRLRAVATDGHRLAISDTDLIEGREEKKQVILPRKGVTELQRLLEEKGRIEVQLGPNHVRVKFSAVCFTSKLIDGSFPEYQRVIPNSPENKLEINTKKLKNALSRAAILSNEKYRGIRLMVQNKDLVIQAHNPDQEQAEEKMDVEYNGEEIEIGFNVNYLIDALNAIESENVLVLLVDNNSSCLIQDTNDSSYKFVVMPMRL